MSVWRIFRYTTRGNEFSSKTYMTEAGFTKALAVVQLQCEQHGWFYKAVRSDWVDGEVFYTIVSSTIVDKKTIV